MESELWLSCEKTAVLQGGFLLAEKLSGAGKLSDLRKEDWATVGHPVRQAVISICGEGRGGSQDQVLWRKRIVCVLWRKLLETEDGKDIDSAWRESPFFSVQNALPQVSRVVLYELIKSTGFSQVYVELLLCFPEAGLCSELARLAKHIVAENTKEDTELLLDVWWDLWKARGGQEHALDQLFASQCGSYATPRSQRSRQATQNVEPGPRQSRTFPCVQSILFSAIEAVNHDALSLDVCRFALSVSLDTFYTSFLLDRAEDGSPEQYLQSLSRAVCVRRRQAGPEGRDLTEIIREAQRELAATRRPARFRPHSVTLMDAVRTVSTICRAWGERGLLKVPESDAPRENVLGLAGSLRRVIGAVEEGTATEALTEAERRDVDEMCRTLRDLAESLPVPDLQCDSVDMAHVAVAVIDQRLDRYQDIVCVFASELNWALSGNEWINCLKRNKDAFLHKDLVLKLISVLVAKCQMNTDIVQCKLLKEIILDVFSELPLPGKNESLAAVLGSWGNGGLNGTLPLAMSEGFSEELNLSFNSLIQSRAESGLGLAVSAVARVALQDPEATLSRCCHMAVMNLGAEALLAQVLQQLPGLIYPQGSGAEGRSLARGGLLCSCLQEAVQGKLATPQEEGQFLNFLAALMNFKVVASETEEEELSLLPPENVVCSFVLPYLTASSPHSCSLELCLQVLHSALKQGERIGSAHWLMSCSPFPLLAALCQLLNDSYACWEEPVEGSRYVSIESKELLIGALKVIDGLVGREVAAAPGVWSRAVFWLHSKLEGLDWTVYFHLRSILGGHFKNEGPCSLFAVCELSEREWSGLELLQYGQGTGLLAWVECCCMPGLRETMLSGLALDQSCPDQVTMFGKGLLVAVTQTLPWRTPEEWRTLLGALRQLLESGRLYAPYSLEYVDFLPLLDLRPFACELRLSALLLRVFQLLCGASCEGWLPARGWAHAGQLYAAAVRETIASVKGKLPVPPPALPSGASAGQEGLFVLAQLFCHVLHVLVMLPGGAEPLFLCALETLTLYQSLTAAYPASSSSLNRKNTKHFFATLTANLESADMRAALSQKIAQL
ncbi:gem-associated protein 4 [Conger conger]|uniref:gem-associated protein 4 n=1 Tax=Conger conger TaxID=82655 RepID=UPI002A59B9E6|nr:gem-associated protein 4 [Conger conger]